MDRFGTYLLEVKSHLHLDSELERSVVTELYGYLHEKTLEIHAAGNSIDRSRDIAIKSMGRPRVIARLFYEAYSVANMKDALLTGLPYVIVSLLFVSHLWRHPVIAPAFFSFIVAITLLGWWWGKPNWLYSWIGFSLFPLLVAGFTLRQELFAGVRPLILHQMEPAAVARSAGALTFYFLAGWLLLSTTIRVARCDWLLASFMLLPLPALGIWLHHLEQIGGFFQPVNPSIFAWDIQMAAVFALMAISLSTYMRVRQRRYRMISLMIICCNVSAYVTHCIWNELALLPVMLVSACWLVFLFSPVIAVKHSAKHGREISQWIQEFEGC